MGVSRSLLGRACILKTRVSRPRSLGAWASSVGLDAGADSSTKPDGLKETRPNSKGGPILTRQRARVRLSLL